MSKQGQTILTSTELGLLALSDDINHLKGVTATVLTRPAGTTTLVFHTEIGGWRAKLGDASATLTYGTPAATLSDGTGSLLFPAGDKYAIPAPEEITFVGQAADSILTYYWI